MAGTLEKAGKVENGGKFRKGGKNWGGGGRPNWLHFSSEKWAGTLCLYGKWEQKKFLSM